MTSCRKHKNDCHVEFKRFKVFRYKYHSDNHNTPDINNTRPKATSASTDTFSADNQNN